MRQPEAATVRQIFSCRLPPFSLYVVGHGIALLLRLLSQEMRVRAIAPFPFLLIIFHHPISLDKAYFTVPVPQRFEEYP
jgi:hypothetical protein